MSDIMLKTENLGISFGGLKAVQDVNLNIKKRSSFTDLSVLTEQERPPFSICLPAYISRPRVIFTLTEKN